VSSVLGLYVARDSPLHRLPAGVKLVGLVAAAVATHWVSTPVRVGIALLVVAVLFALARIPIGVVRDQARPMLVFALVLGAFQWIVAGWHTAVVVVGVLVFLMLLATLVTLTTRTSALLDTVVRGARPLRRVGVDPERIGLVLALGIRSVAVVLALAEEIREAQWARGIRPGGRAFAVPLLVRSLRHADALGDALAARGVDD
jgi:biotin transport system permease protein